MLRDDPFYKECSFDVILSFANSETEKQRAKKQNSNLKLVAYPLTKNFLQTYYLSTNFSNLKKTFTDINCAADVYSYFVMSYGYKTGTNSGGASGAGQSSGLNPFSPFKVDLGFNFGSFGSWLWIILLGYGIYKATK